MSSESSLPGTGRVMGIDYGRRRIGLAISDPERILASALEVVEAADETAAIRRISAAVVETEAVLAVVGMPINMDGSTGDMAREAAGFADRLRCAIQVPVTTWDERLTTASAERILIDADLSRQKRKAVRDRVAARILLQGYLDALPWRQADAGPEEPA